MCPNTQFPYRTRVISCLYADVSFLWNSECSIDINLLLAIILTCGALLPRSVRKFVYVRVYHKILAFQASKSGSPRLA